VVPICSKIPDYDLEIYERFHHKKPDAVVRSLHQDIPNSLVALSRLESVIYQKHGQAYMSYFVQNLKFLGYFSFFMQHFLYFSPEPHGMGRFFRFFSFRVYHNPKSSSSSQEKSSSNTSSSSSSELIKCKRSMFSNEKWSSGFTVFLLKLSASRS